MNDDYSIQLLEKKLQSVPEDVQFALVSSKTAETLLNIADSFGLREAQIDELFDEVGLVMLGLTNPVNFIGNLSGRLAGVPRDKIKQMVERINEEIFKPIKSSLQKIHNIDLLQPPQAPVAKPEEKVAVASRETIWHAVSKKKPEDARALITEYHIRDLQKEKNDLLGRMTELNKKMNEAGIKNPAVTETYRAETLSIQNKISEIDTELRELRKGALIKPQTPNPNDQLSPTSPESTNVIKPTEPPSEDKGKPPENLPT